MAKFQQSLGKIGRVEREQRYNKIVLYSTASIITIIVLIIAWGTISSTYIIPNQTLVTVNGIEVTTAEYQVRVRLERQRLVNLHSSYLQLLQIYGEDEAFLAQALSTMRQVQFQLDGYTMGRSILDALIDEKIIIQEAIALGITVSDEEIEKLFEEQFNFFPNGEPTQPIIPTTAPTSTLTSEQLTLVPLIPTETLVPTEEIIEDETDEATEEAIEEEIEEEIASPTPLFEFPTATPTQFTEDMFDSAVEEYLIRQEDDINLTREDLFAFLKAQLYREKLIEELSKDLPYSQDMVWARHILVSDETTMNELVARLDNGEDWILLAAEYSQDTSNSESGGDLGWFNVTTMVPEFTTVVFNTPIGMMSEPFQTDFGWHIIQVIGHEDRPLSSEGYEAFKSENFNTWLTTTRAKLEQTDKIVIEDFWEKRIPLDPTVTNPIQ